ncbi:hypothetical protein SAMD00019534_048570 [Acytostelium subglobosum LB1]|uniref:hypothetical protein n=1 Tax=Acytostelium subglobosum LB1 TaxID=1410327 RepID=UPI00064481E7|nr:hypothetical protein SAMD00019534_048570 [Acytostelium subglobosum LB1]GAM21682.1 hypothetical protein SAMD00019534_048570 [Acytostelium subglobosum LB1]|eukprot:XP_012755801.1 hypothetical protein SAMD00019534_048570 [Acytostelium subglobosum LB1]
MIVRGFKAVLNITYLCVVLYIYFVIKLIHVLFVGGSKQDVKSKSSSSRSSQQQQQQQQQQVYSGDDSSNLEHKHDYKSDHTVLLSSVIRTNPPKKQHQHQLYDIYCYNSLHPDIKSSGFAKSLNNCLGKKVISGEPTHDSEGLLLFIVDEAMSSTDQKDYLEQMKSMSNQFPHLQILFTVLCHKASKKMDNHNGTGDKYPTLRFVVGKKDKINVPQNDTSMNYLRDQVQRLDGVAQSQS